MTEKEKAKAYDEAIERVKKLYGNGITEEIFPEIKEDDAERIKKNCIHFLELQKQHHVAIFEIEECIDWLEKQVEQKKQVHFPKFTFDDILALQCCMGTVKKVQEDKELYEQLNLIHDKIHDAYWLEKQGEQTSAKTNERAWLYLVSDVLTWQDGIGQYLDDPRVQELAKRLCKEYAQKLYNPSVISNSSNTVKNGQKSAYKVEPKFHKGDWITIDKPCQIININDKGNYIVQYCDDEKTHELSKNFCESYFHFWTIKDAKDGDVLADEDNNICIFKKCEDKYWHSYIYLVCDGKLRGFSIGGIHKQTDTNPTTKEQHDALMKEINDAEYEWDAEKKELNKKVK